MPQSRGNLYTFGFAAAVCVFCSVILAVSATYLKPRQEINERLDIVKNILIVAGYSEEELEKKSGREMLDLFRRDFHPIILNKKNAEVRREEIEKSLMRLNYPREKLKELFTFELLKLFERKKGLLAAKAGMKKKEFDPGYKSLFIYRPGGKLDSYIIPISGPGLWDMMYGYVALQPDLNSVKGITFYEHKETPGLGGECDKPAFRNQFIGKKIFDGTGTFVSVNVAKGKASDRYRGAKLDHYVDGISGATLTGKGITNFLRKDVGDFVEYFKILRASETPNETDGDGKSDTTDTRTTKGGRR